MLRAAHRRLRCPRKSGIVAGRAGEPDSAPAVRRGRRSRDVAGGYLDRNHGRPPDGPARRADELRGVRRAAIRPLNMNRSLIVLIGALALCGAIFAGSYFTARQATVVCCTRTMDDLSWLRTEFHLGETGWMAPIRELHEGYLIEMWRDLRVRKSPKKKRARPALGKRYERYRRGTGEIERTRRASGPMPGADAPAFCHGEPGDAAGRRQALPRRDETAYARQPRANGTIHAGRHRS